MHLSPKIPGSRAGPSWTTSRKPCPPIRRKTPPNRARWFEPYPFRRGSGPGRLKNRLSPSMQALGGLSWTRGPGACSLGQDMAGPGPRPPLRSARRPAGLSPLKGLAPLSGFVMEARPFSRPPWVGWETGNGRDSASDPVCQGLAAGNSVAGGFASPRLRGEADSRSERVRGQVAPTGPTAIVSRETFFPTSARPARRRSPPCPAIGQMMRR